MRTIIYTNRKKSKFLKIFISIIVFLFVGFNIVGLFLGNFFYENAMLRDTNQDIDLYKAEASIPSFNPDKINQLNKEEIYLKSNYGYKMHGMYIPNPKKTENTVIVLHGLHGSIWTSMKYAEMYLDKGFNVLAYDARKHGKTGGGDITYGYYEKYDLEKWVKFIKEKHPNGIIGVHGESMGAATALLHSKINEEDKEVSFYVADCSFSDLEEEMKHLAKEEAGVQFLNKHDVLTNYVLLYYTNLISSFRSKFTFKEVSPIKAVKDVKTPIMFIHGKVDKFIPPSMTLQMYEAKSGDKDLFIANNKVHTFSILYDKERYYAKVQEFLDKTLNTENGIKLKKRG